MRQKSENIFQFGLFENENALPKIVRKYRAEYREINDILAKTPKIVGLAHKDFETLGKSTAGRISSFSSESLLRALIVKQKEGLDYREACIRISESEFLQDFCMFSRKNSIDYTLLCKSFCAISPQTWELINQSLANQSIKNESIKVDVIRTDSTVVETNIHWPTDSSLLWDVYRVIDRIFGKIREIDSATVPFRFHHKKLKNLHIFVTRYASSKSKKRQRQVNGKMKKLINRVETAVTKVSIFLDVVTRSTEMIPLIEELKKLMPSMNKVVSCAHRRWVNGEKVPVEDKVFSIFEPHTELIKRGRRDKPVEFGHKIVLNQSKEKFITGYQVLEHKLDDSALLESVIEQHEDQFGKKPTGLVADRGFCPDNDTLAELCDEIEFLEIPRCNRDFADAILSSAQQFRAGIEGSISCLKRASRLSRCFFKGFRNFSSAVGSAIFCHNLMVLSRKLG